MKNLIGMTDYCMELTKNDLIGSGSIGNDVLFKISYYANFLRQPLELWMFVPSKLVDGVWVVLEEPETKEDKLRQSRDAGWWNGFVEYKKEYQQVKERCLFDGFEIIKHPYLTDDKSIALNEIINVFWHNNITGWNLSEGIYTIEDLVKYKPLLTSAAQKYLGLRNQPPTKPFSKWNID